MLVKKLIKKLPSILIGGSSLLFAIVFFGFGQNILLATQYLLFSMIATAIILLISRCEVTKSQWATVGATILFAGLTYVLQNKAFIMWRSTITGIVIAFVLFGLYFFKKTPFEYLLGRPLDLTVPQSIWLRVNVIWGIYMLVCALINTILVLYFSEDIWVTVKTFGIPALSFIFMLGLFSYLYKEHRKNRSPNDVG